MAACMNKKQISCLAAGLCCVVALVAFSIWAGVEGLFDNLYPKKNVTEPAMPIKDRRGFIFSRSPEHPESVRIIASIATSKPVAILPPASRRMAKLKMTPETTMATTASSQNTNRSDLRLITTRQSFFDLPDTHTENPPTRKATPARVEPREYFKQPLNSINWDQESLNINKLHSTVSRMFGINLDKTSFYDSTNREGSISADGSSWVTLSYLSLSIFLMRQMDHLMKLQSKEGKGRQLVDSVTNPWTYNSLNLLFTEPGNVTDIYSVVNNEVNEDSPNDYMWATHNILRASEDAHGIDCIWTAYCVELDNRASVQSVTGTVARMNGILLKTITGWLKPSAAVIQFLRSSFEWQGMDCNYLFPRCQPEEAVNYLVQLATATSH